MYIFIPNFEGLNIVHYDLLKQIILLFQQKHAQHIKNWETYIERYKHNYRDYQVSVLFWYYVLFIKTIQINVLRNTFSFKTIFTNYAYKNNL